MTPNTATCLRQSYQRLSSKLKGLHFIHHSKESGFRQRREKKLTGKLLLVSFFLMALQGKNSFHLWAEKVSLYSGHRVSKQAIWKRMTAAYVRFLESILSEAMKRQIAAVGFTFNDRLLRKRYNRVLIQDSTCIALPRCLFWCFPGNTSRGERKAGLKIQVVYDLLSNHFVYLEITPYTANDQSQSKNILSIAQKNDLIIRDLGYFITDCFKQLLHNDIHFVSRMRYGIKVSDLKNGQEINLLRYLRKHAGFDKWVNIGMNSTTAVRLIAIALPQEIASRRRQKAKLDRDRRLRHSKDYYEQLGYSIYLTSETQERFNSSQIAKLYNLRWRIETIFKCWKSNFHLQTMIPTTISMQQFKAEAIIYMLLIFCLLFMVTAYCHLLRLGYTSISIVKLSRFIANNLTLILNRKLTDLILDFIKYCSYEKRKDRFNFIQKLNLS